MGFSIPCDLPPPQALKSGLQPKTRNAEVGWYHVSPCSCGCTAKCLTGPRSIIARESKPSHLLLSCPVEPAVLSGAFASQDSAGLASQPHPGLY